MALPFLTKKKEGEKPAEKHAGLFASHTPQGPSSADITEISTNVNNVSRRLRIIEERYTNLRKKTQLTDQNMLTDKKEVSKEIKTLNTEFIEFKKSFDDLREKIKLIVRELKSCAKNEDVLLLQKYIGLWDPVQFATLNDVQKIIEESVEDKIQDMHIKIQEERFIEERVKEEVKAAMQELLLRQKK